MIDTELSPNTEDEIESAIIEAELFLKYQVPHRAVEKLRGVLERRPHSIRLRERLREIAAAHQKDEAARQCLALANLYIAREDFDHAHERLLEAKHHDARISIASGLDAIRRARNPTAATHTGPLRQSNIVTKRVLLAGELAAVSIFDVVQVLENGHHTGVLTIVADNAPQDTTDEPETYRVHFNEGHIVGAIADDVMEALDAFHHIIEIASGTFEFERAAASFPVTIHVASNTNLILDTLRQLDEARSK